MVGGHGSQSSTAFGQPIERLADGDVAGIRVADEVPSAEGLDADLSDGHAGGGGSHGAAHIDEAAVVVGVEVALSGSQVEVIHFIVLPFLALGFLVEGIEVEVGARHACGSRIQVVDG